MFIPLRRITFEKVSKKIQELIDDKVKYISVTLDKVTVQRTSYTVILTYCFYDGEIHVLLNKLEKLGLEDYDADGTAAMVIRVLTETLAVTEQKLAQLLIHFVYCLLYTSPSPRDS